ncbi:MAG: tyrosine-type recombinase/integrase [Armatimonadetes bacterium]|nr:tyrosine-type recombinase/integrase [Armatimonadota bacterium]
MRRTSLPYTKSDSNISVADVKNYSEGWFLSCEISQHSPSTLNNRKLYIRNLLWFFEKESITTCGVTELRRFILYIQNGHKDPEGRWGNPHERNAVKPGTIATYHRNIRAFFNWVVQEGLIENSPMERIPCPTDRPDDVHPFTDAQVQALLNAAKKTMNPRRDEAIVWALLDTGLRASELCSLRFCDLDMQTRQFSVEGKGGKRRAVPFGKTTAKALWVYLKDEQRESDDPVFYSAKGEHLSKDSLLLLIKRLQKAARATGARFSPHTFRHTFAVGFLRNGGNQFSLMQILGHTNIRMTARYVQLAQADIQAQHRQFSPADRLKQGGR